MKTTYPANNNRQFVTGLLHIKKLCVLCLLLCAANNIYAFAYKENGDNDKKQDNLTWKLDATVNNVSFYHVISECDGKKVVLLKFVNKNSSSVSASFKEFFTTQTGSEQTPFAGKIKLALRPGETVAQSCSDNTCKECLILPEQAFPTHKVTIQEFEFKDIDVSAAL